MNCPRCYGTGYIPSETCTDCVDCQDICPVCKGIKEMTINERLSGKITKVDKEKGYGFIQSEDMKFTRFHFLWSALLPASKEFLNLEVGDKCEFQPLKKEDSGWHALKIKVV